MTSFIRSTSGPETGTISMVAPPVLSCCTRTAALGGGGAPGLALGGGGAPGLALGGGGAPGLALGGGGAPGLALGGGGAPGLALGGGGAPGLALGGGGAPGLALGGRGGARLHYWHLSRLPVEELPAVQAGYFEQPLLSESGPAYFQ